MLATLALFGTLLTAPVEKVNFAHNFTKGQTLAYDLVFGGSGSQGDMEMQAAFTLVYGDKNEKGTAVVLKPKSFKMTANGNAMDRSEGLGDQQYTLDANGMPDSISLNSETGILVIPMVLSYLPNKELEVGESFDFNYSKEDVSFKGTGRFEGMEKVGEKTWPKLQVKAVLTPGHDGQGDLTYSVFFDPESGHVALIKGGASVENNEFTFTFTKK